MCGASAQVNQEFKKGITTAWESHKQGAYEAAEASYISALKSYTSPDVKNSIKPEYKDIAKKLEKIFKADQKIRNTYLKKNYPLDSPKRVALITKMNEIDSVNLMEVEAILEEHGWLGTNDVGYFGNKAIFYVLQHADVATQNKYFTEVVEAVALGYVEKFQLAYLIDRISFREKRLLMFGSESRQDPETTSYYVAPTYGVDTLDERRALVDLEPMTVYVKKYKMTWDADQYKKDLPALMERLGY